LAWNFSRLGLVPDTGAGTALLPRLVGHSTALRLTLSGIPVDGERALELGLVDELVEPDELLERAIGVARELSSGSRSAIGLIKKLTYDSYGRPAAAHISASTAALNQCFDSPDYQNAVEGFLARRSAASDK
jgi:enoyl-CoA hydratase